MPIVLKRFSDLVEFRPDAEAIETYHLDVRDLLLDGGSPYEIIMDCAAQIDDTNSLIVHAVFEPKPLVRQLQRMGLAVTVAQVEPDHWTITVQRPRLDPTPAESNPA